MRRVVVSLLAVAVVYAVVPACSREGKASAEAPAGLFREAAQVTVEKDVAVPGQASLAPLIKRLRPAVVNISTTTAVKQGRGPRSPEQEFLERFFGGGSGGGGDGQGPRTQRGTSLGSGFVISSEGYVLTNNHVVKDATEIRVKLTDKREFSAEVVGKDALVDVALLKLKNPPRDLPTVVLGDSDALEQGDFVLALGSPFGLADTATFGIVSTKHRNVNNGAYDDFIQVDAAINPGNSGGPLFNLRGEVVGINTMILAPQGTFVGVGFAVPITLAKSLLPQLQSTGKVVRGYLGVSVAELSPDLAQAFGLKPDQKGALVQQVVKGTPAEKAGLEPGDLVVAIDGKEVDGPGTLTRSVATVPPGQKVSLTVLRRGAEKKISFAVAKRPDEASLARGEAGGEGEEDEREEGRTGERGGKSKLKLGITVQPLTRELAQQLGVEPGEGVVVVEVDPDGPAGRVSGRDGVREGDVIVEANRERVKSPADLSKALGKLKDGEMALLRVKRGGNAVFVAVPYGGRK